MMRPMADQSPWTVRSPALRNMTLSLAKAFSMVTCSPVCFGVEKGPHWRGDRRPKGTPLLMGFTMAPRLDGGLGKDAGGGDDIEDPSCPPGAWQVDQGDLSGAWDFPEGCAQGSSVGGDRVPLRA